VTEQSYVYYGQYHGIGLISRYIQLFNWSWENHTASFEPPNVYGEFGEVVEAWRKGVTRNHWTENHAPGTLINVYRIPCTQKQAESFYSGMDSLVGKEYDFLGVVGFRLRANIQNPDKYFCSEAVFSRMLLAGMNPLTRIPSHKVYPHLMTIIPAAEFVCRLEIPKKGKENG
jgi:uncharacterized protein YycO